MAEFRLGPLTMKLTDDYTPRMLVVTAPDKPAPKVGMMVTKQEQKFARNVTFATEEVADGTTSEAYAEAQLAAMKGGLPGFQLLKRSTVPVGGKDTPLIEIQSTGPEGRLLQAMTAYVVRGSTAYTLSASQMAGLPYQSVRAEYLQIFSTFSPG